MVTRVKERPILFSGEMVRAVLAGRKTQTRRIVKPGLPSVAAVRKKAGIGYGWMICADFGTPDEFRPVGPVWAVKECGGPTKIRCPYGQPGDRLWVRETFSVSTEQIGLSGRIGAATPEKYPELRVWYDADNNRPTWADARWRPSIHMPRWASRLSLEIVDIRVQELHAISNADVGYEGVDVSRATHSDILTAAHCYGMDVIRHRFASLWERINGAGAWSVNPWVWAIEFRKVES